MYINQICFTGKALTEAMYYMENSESVTQNFVYSFERLKNLQAMPVQAR